MNAPDVAPEAGLLSRLKASLVGRLSLLLLQWGIPLLLLAVIGHRLTQLSWRQIWEARPANPGWICYRVELVLEPWSLLGGGSRKVRNWRFCDRNCSNCFCCPGVSFAEILLRVWMMTASSCG